MIKEAFVKIFRKDPRKTLWEHIRDVLNDNSVKRVVDVSVDLLEAAEPLLDPEKRKNKWNYARAGFNIGKVLLDINEIYAEQFFESEGWVMPFSHDFNYSIYQILKNFPHKHIHTASDDNDIVLIDLDDTIQAGWMVPKKGGITISPNVYVESAFLVESRAKIKQLLWDKHGGTSLVMRRSKNRVSRNEDEESGHIIFEPDSTYFPMQSANATDYAAYLKRAIDAGVSRSVMFYGPPGTGKSTMARTIVENLQLRSFRIRVQDIEGIDSSTVFEALTIFEPQAIILDDFDRIISQTSILETLEHFKKTVRLVMATVNNRSRLDDAIRRPGRFDEMVYVKRLDDYVIRSVLGSLADEAFDIVKNWPIVFIEEYVIRRRFMSAAEATSTIKELQKRVDSLKKYEEDDAEENNLTDNAKPSPFEDAKD